jgi:hypothetical protein
MQLRKKYTGVNLKSTKKEIHKEPKNKPENKDIPQQNQKLFFEKTTPKKTDQD